MVKFCQKRGRVFPSGGRGWRRRDFLRFKIGFGMRSRRGVCVTGVFQVTGGFVCSQERIDSCRSVTVYRPCILKIWQRIHWRHVLQDGLLRCGG